MWHKTILRYAMLVMYIDVWHILQTIQLSKYKFSNIILSFSLYLNLDTYNNFTKMIFVELWSYLEVGTRFVCTKFSFVWVITTVIFSVTFPRGRNAPSIPTSELSSLACYILTILFICNQGNEIYLDHVIKRYWKMII